MDVYGARVPRAAILDVDGTLVDTNYHHALAWSALSASTGSSSLSGGCTATSEWAGTSTWRHSPATT